MAVRFWLMEEPKDDRLISLAIPIDRPMIIAAMRGIRGMTPSELAYLLAMELDQKDAIEPRPANRPSTRIKRA